MSAELKTTIIEPRRNSFDLNLGEVWRYRDLMLLLAWRDISARFRQSIAGYGWAIVRPLITAGIYALVFNYFVKIETEQPYVLFAFSALIPWLYFSTSLTSITGSVVANAAMLTKVYFPRLVLPFAKIAVGLVEVLLQLVVMGLLMAWYQWLPGPQILLLPLFLLIAIATSLACGIWLTAINVKYRDVGMAVPFIIQIWMYLCPIIYPISMVPEQLRIAYAINPMVGVIEGFRWSILGTAPPNWTMVAISFLGTAIILISGLIYFRRVESTFADII